MVVFGVIILLLGIFLLMAKLLHFLAFRPLSEKMPTFIAVLIMIVGLSRACPKTTNFEGLQLTCRS